MVSVELFELWHPLLMKVSIIGPWAVQERARSAELGLLGRAMGKVHV